MQNTQPRLTVVGRANMDVYPRIQSYDVSQDEPFRVSLKGKTNSVEILTKEKPTPTDDKVHALDSLDPVLEKFSYEGIWGGGGVNSVVALAEYATSHANIEVAFCTPSRPNFTLNGEDQDLKDFLESRNQIECTFLDKQRLLYNIVIPGTESNKIIFRNPQKPDEYDLHPVDVGALDISIGLSNGVLINSLSHLPTSRRIVQKIHAENTSYATARIGEKKLEQRLLSGDYLQRPKRRTVLTVLTGKLDTRTLLRDLVPYTGIIANKKDFLQMFGIPDEGEFEKDGTYEQVIGGMKLLREGMANTHGIDAKIEDELNNIYVTDGGNGYLVNIGDEVHHVKLKDKVSEEFAAQLKKSRTSTTGAGDAAAAAILFQETHGRAHNFVRETGAVIHNFVFRGLGYNRELTDADIEKTTYDLNGT